MELKQSRLHEDVLRRSGLANRRTNAELLT
jgi:hypothetical protein